MLEKKGEETKEKNERLERKNKILEKELNNSKKTNEQLKKGLERFKRKISNLTEQNDNIKNHLEKEIKEIEDELNKLRTDISTILASETNNLTLLATTNVELITQANEVIAKIVSLRTELNKEQGWWDKWINDNGGKD